MLKAHRRRASPSKKKSSPASLTRNTGEQPQRAYAYYSTARNEKKGAYTMSTRELASKAREYKELQALIEEAEAELEAIRDELKAELQARSTDEMTVDVYKIRWTKVLSNRFDSSAFKKAMPELHAQFTKQTESRRFTIA